jgi:hypothetical protein
MASLDPSSPSRVEKEPDTCATKQDKESSYLSPVVIWSDQLILRRCWVAHPSSSQVKLFLKSRSQRHLRDLEMTGVEVPVTALTALASRSPPPRNLHLRHHAACVSLCPSPSHQPLPCHVIDSNALSFVVTNNTHGRTDNICIVTFMIYSLPTPHRQQESLQIILFFPL